MSLVRLATLGLAGALAAAAGCATKSASVVQLDAQDNGISVHLRVGEKLKLSLASNITTGYSWELVELDTTVVENTAQEYVPDPAPEGMTGVGGIEIWDFTGRSPGTTPLRLEYRRPWEPKDIEAADSFELAVTVTAAE